MTDAKGEASNPYLVGLRDMMLGGWFNQDRGQVVDGFPVGASDVVVDVGSGDGAAAAFCSRQGAHVIMCDIDEQRLQKATAHAEATSGRRPEAHVTDGASLPLGDGVATRIVCTEVLEHVDDPSGVMAELVRIGRPDALYLLSVPGAAQEHMQKTLAPPAYFAKPNHIRIFEADQFHKLVEDAGLIIEDRQKSGFFWSLLSAIFWQTEVPISQSHPMFEAWAETWSRVLDGRDGAKIKRALDDLLPKNEVVVARKPSSASTADARVKAADRTARASILSALRELDDGAPLGDVLAEELNRVFRCVVRPLDLGDRLQAPALSQLYVRRSGLLEDWADRGNVCLAGEDAVLPEIGSGLFFGRPATQAMLVLGARARLKGADMIGENSLLVLGDRSNLHQARISVTGDATVMIGEGTTATLSAQLDARNGGAILVGADGMWANDLRIITDDMHAIRDKKTGERINTFGGRVLVERHVWFGERVMVVGDCRIGEDTVIGSGAIVKSGALPPNSICVGQPARAIRTGTTWTRDDLP